MNEQTKTKMDAAGMDAVMVAAEITNYDDPQAVEALKAAGNARGASPAAVARATKLAVAWIDANDADALAIIDARIARRAAKAAAPQAAGVARGLNFAD